MKFLLNTENPVPGDIKDICYLVMKNNGKTLFLSELVVGCTSGKIITVRKNEEVADIRGLEAVEPIALDGGKAKVRCRVLAMPNFPPRCTEGYITHTFVTDGGRLPINMELKYNEVLTVHSVGGGIMSLNLFFEVEDVKGD